MLISHVFRVKYGSLFFGSNEPPEPSIKAMKSFLVFLEERANYSGRLTSTHFLVRHLASWGRVRGSSDWTSVHILRAIAGWHEVPLRCLAQCCYVKAVFLCEVFTLSCDVLRSAAMWIGLPLRGVTHPCRKSGWNI